MCAHRLADLWKTQPYYIGSLTGDAYNGEIYVYTQKYFIIVAPFYPGEPGLSVSLPAINPSEPTPTPISSSVAAAGKTIIDEILSTFQAHPNQSGC